MFNTLINVYDKHRLEADMVLENFFNHPIIKSIVA